MKFIQKIAITVAGLALASSAFAQNRAANKAQLDALKTTANQMDSFQRQMLSTGMKNLLHLSHVPPKAQLNAKGFSASAFQGALDSALAQMAQRAEKDAKSGFTGKMVSVSAPELDYVHTRIGGFTQSETSAAWCGQNVVVGFNDSGAYVRSYLMSNGGLSFSGVAYSRNGGASFYESPTLTPPSDEGGFLGGDPSVVCTSANDFYYASLYQDIVPATDKTPQQVYSGIAVNYSPNGGAGWATPVVAVQKNGYSHILDKEWMSADPTNSNRLFITYTDFDGSFSGKGECSYGFRTAIELVWSANGGKTWSKPLVIDEQCPSRFDGLQGSQVAVGPDGDVYVAWVYQNPQSATLRFRRSHDHGNSFGTMQELSTVTLDGPYGAGALQGLFRTNVFPALTVDTTNKPSRGNIYVAWADGRNNSIYELNSFLDSYQFGDIMLMRSSDGGANWTNPVSVSPMPDDFSGAGRDQFMPGLAVDPSGKLAVCYSDRRNDPNNNLVDHYCSFSSDQGTTFIDARETMSSFTPSHYNDAYINSWYMGDYDVVTSDHTGANGGFFNSFEVVTNSNPDVYGFRF